MPLSAVTRPYRASKHPPVELIKKRLYMQEKDASIKGFAELWRHHPYNVFILTQEENVPQRKSISACALCLLILILQVYGVNPAGAAPQRATARDPVGADFSDLPATVKPVSGAVQAITSTPFADPTSAPTEAPRSGPPLSLTLTLLYTCCSVGLVVGVLVVAFALAMGNKKGEKSEKDP